MLSFWLSVGLIFGLTAVTSGQDESPGLEVASGYVKKVVIGFGGQPKLGHWTPIFVYPTSDPGFADSFRAQTVDGDQMPIVYTGSLSVSADGKRLEAWTRLGRSRGAIKLELLKSGSLVETIEVPIQPNVVSVQSSTKTELLTIGTGQAVSSLIERNITSGVSARDAIVVNLDSLEEISDHWFCLQGIKTIVLFDQGIGSQLSDSKIKSLTNWIDNGGHLVLSVDPGRARALTDGQLKPVFLPEVVGTTAMKTSSAIESFTSSDEQLIAIDGDPIPTIEVEVRNGVVSLNQNRLPLVVRQGRGLGQITLVTLDLSNQRLQGWKGYKNLLRRVVDTTLGSRPDTRETTGNRVSHSGYQDLVGQLRVPMDQFSSVKFITFTLVAVLIGLYILCIGPGDYFLLRKLIGKMELTWVTFLLITLVFCGIAWFTSKWAKPDAIQVNQLEIIDIDAESGMVRGNIWANLYSPVTESNSIGISGSNRLEIDVRDNLISWQGLPGSGLGGMQSQAVTQFVEQPYECRSQANSGLKTTLQDLPIQVSSSKQIFAQWWSETQLANKSRLTFNPRLQRLEGTFANPFDRQLRNCRLFFQNSVYVMNRPLEANEYVDASTDSDTSLKAIKVHLSRRKATEDRKDRSSSAPWDPSGTDLRRIADMLMFYEAAGGYNYTKLTHDYQGFIDLSGQLDVNRAILVGELAERITDVEINGESPGENYDSTLTVVRVVLPVAEKTRSRN